MEEMQESILEAVKKRQSEFLANLETMTLKKCRKQLEQDMGLEPGGLDSHKDYVRDLIEKMVVNPEPEGKSAPAAAEPASDAPKKAAVSAHPKKRKEVEVKQPAAKGYSSKVEKLKRVCKSATIAIPPSVYTRVTSEQDVSSRLKDLLSKHGLAKDFSVEEIARVKRNLKKERDLDGIDTENILDSGRARRPRMVRAEPAASASNEEEDWDTTGDENEQPDNGKSYSAGGKEEPEPDAKPKAGSNDARMPEAAIEDAASDGAAKQSLGKSDAPGRAAKRLADWSESDDE